MSLSPSRVRRPSPRYLLDDMRAFSQRQTVHDPGSVWLRQYKAEFPLNFRLAARRFPVLSMWQVDRRKAWEEVLDLDEEGDGEGPSESLISRQIHRDWLNVTCSLEAV